MAKIVNVRYNEERKLLLAVTLAGVGVTGLSVKLNIQQLSDSYWWDGDSWEAAAVELDMVERDDVDQKGVYEFDFTPPNDSDSYVLHAYIAAGPNAFDSYEVWETTPQHADIKLIQGHEALVTEVGEGSWYLNVYLDGLVATLIKNLKELMKTLWRTKKGRIKV